MAMVQRSTGKSAPVFIACKRSPRFIWRMPVSMYTPLDSVGRKLDYFAAGYCCGEITDERGTVRVIETQTSVPLFSEVALLKYLQDSSPDFTYNEWSVHETWTSVAIYLKIRYLFHQRRNSASYSIWSIPPDEEWCRNNSRWVNQIHPINLNHSRYLPCR